MKILPKQCVWINNSSKKKKNTIYVLKTNSDITNSYQAWPFILCPKASRELIQLCLREKFNASWSIRLQSCSLWQLERQLWMGGQWSLRHLFPGISFACLKLLLVSSISWYTLRKSLSSSSPLEEFSSLSDLKQQSLFGVLSDSLTVAWKDNGYERRVIPLLLS